VRGPGWRRTATRGGPLLVALFVPLLVLISPRVARAEDPPPIAAPPPTAAPPPIAVAPADSEAAAETQSAAAQRAAQEIEAQVIELRRQLEALERQRVSYDDIRRRLDQIEAEQAEARRQAAATRDGAPPETSVVRFRDDGFEIRSPDNGFYLRPRMRVQAIYTGELTEQGAQDPAAPDVSNFSVAHAEVILEGHVGGPFFQYRVQLDAALATPLKDAYVAWRPFRLLTIEAGQFKVPYGLQRQYWTAELEFVDFSTPMAAFSLERDVGVMLVGRPIPGRLTVQAAALNGAGAGVPNDNLDLAYALRVVASPFGALPVTEGDIEGHRRPLLAIGLSGYYNLAPTDVRARTADPMAPIDLDGDGRTDNVGIWQGGAELRALWRGAALQAEWFGRLEDPGVAGPSRRYWGGYAQASYFLLPRRLQIAARIGRADLPLYGASAEEHLLRGTREDEQSGAMSAYLRGHRIKVQMDVSHLSSPDAQTAPTAYRLRGAVQIGF
jgi:phosphate-selective porin OprO/OprP